MATRPTTKLKHEHLRQDVQTFLELAPTATIDDAVKRFGRSRSTINRAFRADGTTFFDDRRGRLLDRAALRLIDSSAGRGQSAALYNAAATAGGYRKRHLCEPFRERFGITPGVAWALGCSIRELERVADSPRPHSRRDSAAYARRRRRIIRVRRRLIAIRYELTPATVIADRVDQTLRLSLQGSSKPAKKRRRARPRQRGRSR